MAMESRYVNNCIHLSLIVKYNNKTHINFNLKSITKMVQNGYPWVVIIY